MEAPERATEAFGIFCLAGLSQCTSPGTRQPRAIWASEVSILQLQRLWVNSVEGLPASLELVAFNVNLIKNRQGFEMF